MFIWSLASSLPCFQCDIQNKFNIDVHKINAYTDMNFSERVICIFMYLCSKTPTSNLFVSSLLQKCA